MMLFALVVERPPLEWSGFLGAASQWVQDAGLYAFIWLVLLAASYALVPEFRHRSKWGALHSTMTALGVAAIIGFIVFLVLLRMYGKVPDVNFKRAVDFNNPNAPPPETYTTAEKTALGLAGLAAILACALPLVRDLFQNRVVFRRIWALSRLSIKEAWSRGIVWVCAIVPLIYLYADWYISSHAEDQLRTRISIAYFSMTILFLVSAGLLGSFSIPADIMNQNIFTIVTKPVERYEIVLGRFLGYGLLLLVELLGLTAISCLYIGRGLSEQAKEESYHARVPLYAREVYFYNTGFRDRGTNVGREWAYRTYITGVNPQLGNTKTQYAIWSFDQLPSALLRRAGDELVPIEFTFDIFRTTTGQEGKGVYCSFTVAKGTVTPEELEALLKPGSAFRTELNNRYAKQRVNDEEKDQKIQDDIRWQLFKEYGIYQKEGISIKDYHTQSLMVPAKFFSETASTYKETAVDEDNKPIPMMRVIVNVENDRFSRLQLVGMAKHDLYILVEDRDFFLNFFKGSLCIYMLTLIVLGLAVVCSTYLSGIVSLLLTAFLCIGGLFLPFVQSLAEGKGEGGGPGESIYRLLHKTPTSVQLDQQSTTVSVITKADAVYQWWLRLVLNVLPDVGLFSPKDYVANGFDLTWGTLLLLNNILPAIAYLAPWLLLSYYLIKSREIANP
jgi:ABC-type transport system involved in multi-copper enzyme maturation permease subunit